MKAFAAGIFLFLGVFALGYGQSAGNSGNNVNWPPQLGESSTSCGSTQMLSAPNSGNSNPTLGLSWPMNQVVKILKAADPYFVNYNLGQLIQQYNGCSCVITYFGEGWFRVAVGGSDLLINIEMF